MWLGELIANNEGEHTAKVLRSESQTTVRSARLKLGLVERHLLARFWEDLGLDITHVMTTNLI